MLVQYRKTLKRDITPTEKEKRALDQGNSGYVIRMCILCITVIVLIFIQLWEQRSRFITKSETAMWNDVTPPMMSDEEPMPDGKIDRRRPSWRSEAFNELMDTLDERANSSFQKTG